MEDIVGYFHSCVIIERKCCSKPWHSFIGKNECFYFLGRENSMSDEISQPMRTELFAASLRADKADLKTFLEALAIKFEGSLPDFTRVTRQGDIFSRQRLVKEIVVSLGENQYRIGTDKQGSLVAAREHVVRGIVLKTEQTMVDQWIDELSDALAQFANYSAQSHSALERFLLQ